MQNDISLREQSPSLSDAMCTDGLTGIDVKGDAVDRNELGEHLTHKALLNGEALAKLLDLKKRLSFFRGFRIHFDFSCHP